MDDANDDDNINGDDVQVEQHYTHTESFSGWTFFIDNLARDIFDKCHWSWR